MEVLKDMFPAMSDNALQIALAECGDNLEAAIDYCLNMETINSLPSQPQQSQQQQQQPQQQQQLSQMEMDEMLARELSNSFANYSPPRARRQPIAEHSVGLSEVDPAVMAEMLKGMATSMIPLLRDQLQSLQIPAVNEQLDAGKLGTVIVTLDEIRVGNTNVPEEGIEIKSEGNEVIIKVKDVMASLQQFKWGYEKLSFPKMKDNGNADASISETTIDIKLRIGGDEFGNPNIAVTHCKVNIGKLDLKISGSFASFVYNSLMGIFKKTIKATLETNFEEMIISSVGDGSTNLF